MRATIKGCEIVWPWPIGKGRLRPAQSRYSAGRKRSRGTRAMAARTRSSVMPIQRSSSSIRWSPFSPTPG